MARRLRPEEKQRLLAELQLSGMSLARFARDRGLHPETLYRWRRAHREREEGERFVEVRLTSSEVTVAPLIVEVVERFRVEVPADFEESHLRRLLTVLSSC